MYLQNCYEFWYCIECCSTIFTLSTPFLVTKTSLAYTDTDSNITQWKDLENEYDSSLSLKP